MFKQSLIFNYPLSFFNVQSAEACLALHDIHPLWQVACGILALSDDGAAEGVDSDIVVLNVADSDGGDVGGGACRIAQCRFQFLVAIEQGELNVVLTVAQRA